MRVLRKIFLMTIFTIGCTELFAQKTAEVRVMSMNIRLGGELAKYKAEPYAAIINEYKPDFVALQEVDYKTPRNGFKDWLNDLALQTGMFPEFFQSINMGIDGGYGTAVLSKYPFYKSTKNLFPKVDKEREPRASGWIYVMLPEDVTARFMTVHLALQNATNTTNNINHINKQFFAEDNLTPGLMIGDFNAVPDSDPINFAKRKWEEMAPGAGYTIPASKPAKQLDYVMAYPKGKWKCVKYEILPHPELSDHCFIVADLTITVE